ERRAPRRRADPTPPPGGHPASPAGGGEKAWQRARPTPRRGVFRPPPPSPRGGGRVPSGRRGGVHARPPAVGAPRGGSPPAGRRAAARLAAGLCAVYLPFAVYTRLLLSGTLFTFLFLAAVAALVTHARRGGRIPLIAAGAALGLAILTRGIALGFLAAPPLWL